MKCILVGLSGYAGKYIRFMEALGSESLQSLAAVVDPYASKAPQYPQVLQQGIPVFDTLSDCFRHVQADLVIISSPIAFHKEQILESIAHGACVLCEKPLVPLWQDAVDLANILGDDLRKLGVGFQWSFSRCMQQLKHRILSGEFGSPVLMKAHISWQRLNSYYTHSSWHGRVRGDAQEWILDSILTNATAHYLHNIFFLLGETMTTSALPVEIQGNVYRAKPIESYDTCFLKGSFANGASFFFTASHGADRNSDPQFEYIFEKAVISFNENLSPCVHLRHSDGRQEICGEPQSLLEEAEKLRWMMYSASDGSLPACTLETIAPHLLVCNAIYDHMPVQHFPENMHILQADPPSLWICGLSDAMEQCYAQTKLPNELGYPWAASAVSIDFRQLKQTTCYQRLLRNV